MSFDDLEMIIISIAMAALLIKIIPSLKKTQRLIDQTENKIKLKRHCIDQIIIFGALLSLFMIVLSGMMLYFDMTSNSRTLSVYWAFLCIFGLEGAALLAIIMLYGRFAWLTSEHIITPTALDSTVSTDDAEWTLKNDILVIYGKKSRKRTKYRIIGDINETAHILEENYIKHI